MFRNLVDDLLEGLTSNDQETSSAWVGVLGALARSSSRLVGSVLDRAMPGVLAQLEDVENADAVEGALVVSASQFFTAELTSRRSTCWFSDAQLRQPRTSPKLSREHWSSSNMTQ